MPLTVRRLPRGDQRARLRSPNPGCSANTRSSERPGAKFDRIGSVVALDRMDSITRRNAYNQQNTAEGSRQGRASRRTSHPQPAATGVLQASARETAPAAADGLQVAIGRYPWWRSDGGGGLKSTPSKAAKHDRPTSDIVQTSPRRVPSLQVKPVVTAPRCPP